MLILLITILTIKILLYPSYYSTDFDVHQNWMRITSQEPISNWYFDTKSIWTLDYPPLFAYFEYFLAIIASKLNKVNQSSLNYKNLNFNEKNQFIILFQRSSVVVCDLLYIFAANYVFSQQSKLKRFLISLPFGLLLIDNIHFQYNGMLMAILIISCQKLQHQKYISSALLFSTLLCLKHIYIYVAPVFFLLIFRGYCIINKFIWKNFIKVSLCCISIVALVFLPFLDIGSYYILNNQVQLKQIITRLFPINRGLVHSYWAPNFWALWCFLDRVLGFIYSRINPLHIRSTLVGGVVQVSEFEFLPQISALTTNICVAVASLWLWKSIIKNPQSKSVFRYATLQSLLFFNFGYHVHEKAIMIPLVLLMCSNYGKKDSNLIFLASWVNSIGLFPLIPSNIEQPCLCIMFLLYHILLYVELKQNSNLQFREAEIIYMNTGIMVAVFNYIIQPYLFPKMAFLPLMVFSLYSSVFNQYWIYWEYKTLNQDKCQLD